jgi:hypothetical protein
MPGSRPPVVIPPDVENVRASPPSPSAPGKIHTSNRQPHQVPQNINRALNRRNAFYQPPPTTFFSGGIGAMDNSVSSQVRAMRSESIASGQAFGALRRGQPGVVTPGGVPLVGDYGDAIRDAVGWAVIRERPESNAGSNAASGTYRYPASNMVIGAALAGQYARRGLGAAVTTPAGYPLVGAYGDVIGRDVGQVRERPESNAGSNAASGTYKYPSRQMVTGAALAAAPEVNYPPRLRPPGLAYRGGMAVISSSPSEDRKRILSSLYGIPYEGELKMDLGSPGPMVSVVRAANSRRRSGLAAINATSTAWDLSRVPSEVEKALNTDPLGKAALGAVTTLNQALELLGTSVRLSKTAFLKGAALALGQEKFDLVKVVFLTAAESMQTGTDAEKNAWQTVLNFGYGEVKSKIDQYAPQSLKDAIVFTTPDKIRDAWYTAIFDKIWGTPSGDGGKTLRSAWVKKAKSDPFLSTIVTVKDLLDALRTDDYHPKTFALDDTIMWADRVIDEIENSTNIDKIQKHKKRWEDFLASTDEVSLLMTLEERKTEANRVINAANIKIAALGGSTGGGSTGGTGTGTGTITTGAKEGEACRLPSQTLSREKLCNSGLDCVKGAGIFASYRCRKPGSITPPGAASDSNTGLIVGGIALAAVLVIALRK